MFGSIHHTKVFIRCDRKWPQAMERLINTTHVSDFAIDMWAVISWLLPQEKLYTCISLWVILLHFVLDLSELQLHNYELHKLTGMMSALDRPNSSQDSHRLDKIFVHMQTGCRLSTSMPNFYVVAKTVLFQGKISKIPWLITNFHDFWPIFQVPRLFQDHFPSFRISMETLLVILRLDSALYNSHIPGDWFTSITTCSTIQSSKSTVEH